MFIIYSLPKQALFEVTSVNICMWWATRSGVLKDANCFMTCFEMTPLLGMILRIYFVFVNTQWIRERRQALCSPSLLPTVCPPPPQFVKDELLPVVTAENLLKSTLLEDNGPQIYCGTALNFIKSVLDYPLLSRVKGKKSLAASTLWAWLMPRTSEGLLCPACSPWVHNVWILK